MDIVSRLKKFITYAKVPVTQFADNCNIARPTLSQLLNGRNKKVSDELISKIHEAYPTLSVLWLMFGEGDMLTDKNIETSQPQNDAIFSFDDTQSAKDEEYTTSISFDKIFDQNEADIFSDDSTAQNLTNRQEQEEKKESKAAKKEAMTLEKWIQSDECAEFSEMMNEGLDGMTISFEVNGDTLSMIFTMTEAIDVVEGADEEMNEFFTSNAVIFEAIRDQLIDETGNGNIVLRLIYRNADGSNIFSRDF